jgi:hypothetical protein
VHARSVGYRRTAPFRYHYIERQLERRRERARVVWGWRVEGQVPDRWDMTGAAVALLGMGIIAFGPQ